MVPLFLLVVLATASAVSSQVKKGAARCYDRHPPLENTCPDNEIFWFYNETLMTCEPRVTPLCGLMDWSKNIFIKQAACKRLCRDPVLGVCATPEPRSRCRGNFPMYRFNPDKMRCERFIYKGCDPKDGLYDTMKECKARCQQFEQDPCVLPFDEGYRCDTRSAIPRYGFDSATGKCELFDYRGCGGNGNNFEEEHECWSTCARHVKNPCDFPIHRGRACGNGTIQTVFGYNEDNKRCEQFGHTGCGGYPNKFGTAEECWTKCARWDTLKSQTRKCLRPAVKQTTGTHERYFYNMTSNTCELSRYWLMDDSKNRFESLEDCENTCKPLYNPSGR